MHRIVLIVLINLFLSTHTFTQVVSKDSIELLLNQASLTIENDSIVSLPIDYKKNGVILIKVIINGKEYVFVFDTGASTCLISKEISDNSKIAKAISNLQQLWVYY